MRVDVPHLKAIESGANFDFTSLLQAFVGTNSPYILQGFTVNNAPSLIGQNAQNMQINVASSIVWMPSDPNGAFLNIPSTQANETLNSASSVVSGSFTANTINYVSVQFTRLTDPTTNDLVSFWDVDADVEFTKTVPLGLVLNYQFVINTSGFGTASPIAIVQTSLSNTIINITNAKGGLFRLGTGGTSPNPDNSWTYPQALENPLTVSTLGGLDPFVGGDWGILNWKNWMDAVMTGLKLVNKSARWYYPGSTGLPGLNLLDTWFDADGSLITSAGMFAHSPSTPGLISWTSAINIRSIIGNLTYTIPTGSVTLADTQVAYVTLVRDQDFQPANTFTFTNGSTTVVSSTTITGISAGDYIKYDADPISVWGLVQTISGNTITLASNYLGTSAAGKALRSQGSYTVSVANPTAVPANQSTYWIAKRDDNGTYTYNISSVSRTSNVATVTTSTAHALVAGQNITIAGVTDTTFNGAAEILSTPSSTTFTYTSDGTNGTSSGGTVTTNAEVYIRGTGLLTQGTSSNPDDTIPVQLLEYIGMPSSSTYYPTYSSNIRGTANENLTSRAGILTDAIGDAQEDRSGYLRSGNAVVWNGAALTFTTDIVLEFLNTKSGTTTTHTIQSSVNSPLAIADGQSIWTLISRTATSENLTIYNSSVTPIPAQTEANKDVFVLFRVHTANGQPYLHIPYHKQVISPNQSVILGETGTPGPVVQATLLDPVSTTLPTGTTYTGDGVTVTNGMTVLFTNLTTGNNFIYEVSGVGTALVWTPQYVFQDFEAPVSGDLVVISKGTVFGNQIAQFNGTNFYVNNSIRLFNGVSGNFWELSSIQYAALSDNTTGTLYSVTASGSENWIVNFSVKRGTAKATGQFFVTTDGSSTAEVSGAEAYINDVGVTFTASITGGVLSVKYTTTSTGVTGTMNYFTSRWADATGGGPTGIPSYSTTGAPGVNSLNGLTGAVTLTPGTNITFTPSGNNITINSTVSPLTPGGPNTAIQYNGGGSLSGNANLEWSTGDNAIAMNGFQLTALTSGINLVDNTTTAAPVTGMQYSASTYGAAWIDYSITRNGSTRSGTIITTNTSTSVQMNDQKLDLAADLGVTFTAIISAGNVVINYTTTSTGFAGTIKYNMRRM